MKKSACAYLHCDGTTLLLYRNKKADDVNHGYYIGIGGKKEAQETIRQCIRREVQEETGIDLPLKAYKYRGKLYFSYPEAEDEIIWIYTAETESRKITDCDEGTPVWVKDEEVLHQKMWEGDRLFLKEMEQSDRIFCFELHYDEKGNLIQAVRREAEDE